MSVNKPRSAARGVAVFLYCFCLQIATVNGANLVAYWAMEDIYGSNVCLDWFGDNHLTINGTVSVSPGVRGNAYTFAGGNSYLSKSYSPQQQTGTFPVFRPGRPYSITMYVKGAPQPLKYIFSEGRQSTGTPVFRVYTGLTGSDTSKVGVLIRTDEGVSLLNNVISSKPILDNAWHHIAWVDNNGSAKLYIDGIQDAANFNYTPSGSFSFDATTIANFVISGELDHGFAGQIDHVAVWDGALTPAEVSNSGTFHIPRLSRVGGWSDRRVSEVDVTVQGNYAYTTTPYGGVSIFDISNPGSPLLTSALESYSLLPGRILVSGDIAYVAGGGLYILNVADRSRPTHVRTLLTTSVVRSVHMEDGKLFVGAKGGLFILGLNEPSNPSLLGSMDIPPATANAEDGIRDIDISNGIAFLAAGANGLVTVDVADPAHPSRIGGMSVGPGSWAHEVEIVGNFAHLSVTDPDNRQIAVHRLKIANVQNPIAPSIVFSQAEGEPASSAIAFPLEVTGDITVISRGAVHFFNTATPAQTTLIRSIPLRPAEHVHGLSVVGDSIWASAASSIAQVDLSEPTDPRLSNIHPTNWRFTYAASTGNYMYAIDGWSSEIFIFDISDPRAIRKLRNVTLAPPQSVSGLAVDSGRLYAWGVGHRIFSLANPVEPELIDAVLAGQTTFVKGFGDYIYVTMTGASFVSHISNPQSLSRFDNGGGQIHIVQNRLFVGNSSSMRVYDITNPAEPALVGTAPSNVSVIDANATHVFTVGNSELLASWDPFGHPTFLLDTFQFPSSQGNSIAAADDRVYYSDGSRVYVVDARDPANLRLMDSVANGSFFLYARGSHLFGNHPLGVEAFESSLPDIPPQELIGVQLAASFVDGQLVIRWPVDSPGTLKLHSSMALGQPWQLVTASPPVDGSFYSYTNRFPVVPAQFYTLLRQ